MKALDPTWRWAELSDGAAEQLWRSGQVDDSWPFADRSRRRFTLAVDSWRAAEAIGIGRVRAVIIDSEPAGFVYWSQVDTAWLPAGVSAVECGTWLASAQRGQGLNPAIKHATIHTVFRTPAWASCQWCVFFIPRDNARALAAMRKLPWPWVCAASDAADAAGTSAAQPFHRLLARRAWETGQPCVLYAISRADWDLLGD